MFERDPSYLYTSFDYTKNLNLVITKVDIDMENYVYFIQQFVKNVRSFSSQYGRNFSISYAASNIIGFPNRFPDHGDFVQTFAMVCIFADNLLLSCKK